LYVDARFTALGFHALLPQQRGDSSLQGFQFTFQQTRLYISQYLPRGQQCLQLARTDPDTGQIERLLQAPIVIKPAVVRVLLNGRAEKIAQFADQTVQGGLGALQPLHQFLPRNGRPPLLQDVVQVIKPLDLGHTVPLTRPC
jgi:hypothetical protein